MNRISKQIFNQILQYNLEILASKLLKAINHESNETIENIKSYFIKL